MPTRDLPDSPSLEHLRKQAKDLCRDFAAGDAAAATLVAEFQSDPGAHLALSGAQRVIARQYGFTSWPKLRAHVDLLTRYTRRPHQTPEGGDPVDEFLRLACLRYGGDDPVRRQGAGRLLADDPGLATTSLHAAAAAGDVRAVRDLLADQPHQVDALGGPYRWEPLLYVIYSRLPTGDHLAVVRLLLDAGADPNAGYLWDGRYAFTALTGTFGEGEDWVNAPPHPQWRDLATALLDAGADANDSQALYNRQFRPGTEHLELLFRYGLGTGDGGPWRTRFPDRLPAPAEMVSDQLLWAAAHDMADRVALLLARGADPDGTGYWFTDDGSTAHQRAVRAGNTAVAKLLAAAGARVVEPDPVEAFLSACLAGDHEGAAGLVSAHPGVVAIARVRQPAAMVVAAERRRPAAVGLLASYGFDVNAADRITALHQAAYDGDLAMAQLLVSLGADPDARDCSFDSPPLGWAEHQRNSAMVEYLQPLTTRPEGGEGAELTR